VVESLQALVVTYESFQERDCRVFRFDASGIYEYRKCQRGFLELGIYVEVKATNLFQISLMERFRCCVVCSSVCWD